MIEWEVEVKSQSRLREVRAYFVEETEISTPLRLVLVGEVDRFERSAADQRVNFADLRFSSERSDELQRGRGYRLTAMSGITWSGNELSIPTETLPQISIYMLHEREGEVLELGDTHMSFR